MRKRDRIFICGVLLVLSAAFLGEAKGAKDTLLSETIQRAQGLVSPSDDVSVVYEASSKHVKITFTTPSDYKRDFSDFFYRWRHNQWVVLQEFKKAGIPVNTVTVETNYVDGGALVRHTHTARHVDQYANLPSGQLWLRAAESYQSLIGSTEWKKLYY